MGRLVVEEVDEAVAGRGRRREPGRPERSWGAGEMEEEEMEVGVCAMVGTLVVDLRLEPNPRLLKREFIELIRTREKERGGGEEEGEGSESRRE
jgi:hypothetical protein